MLKKMISKTNLSLIKKIYIFGIANNHIKYDSKT